MWRLLKTMQLGIMGLQFSLIKDTYQLSHFDEENLSDATVNWNNLRMFMLLLLEGSQKEPELELRLCICCFSFSL